MEQYIALLRGVNVGGKNKVPMSLLRQELELAGFSEVRTYINSGNIAFSCEKQAVEVLQLTIRQVIMDCLQLDIPVAVFTVDELKEAFEHAPSWWGDDPEAKHNALYLIAPAKASSLITHIGSNPEYERVAYHDRIVFWSAPLKTLTRTRLTRIVSTQAYQDVTIRNANTARKLLQL